MTIIIDSISVNRECLEAPPSSAATDRCVADASFHIRSGEGSDASSTATTEIIPFRREADREVGASFYVQASAIPATLSTMITENQFDPANAVLQRDLRNILTVQVRYADARRMISRLETGPEMERLFDDLVNFMFLGEIDSPDSVQMEANRSLFTRLAQLTPQGELKFRLLIDSFLLDNREWLNREDAAAIPRLERMASVLNFIRRIHEATSQLSEETALVQDLRTLDGALVNYLFTGEVAFLELSQNLSSLAAQIYRESEPSAAEDGEEEGERINLYQVLLPALRAFEERPPFNEAGEARTRLNLLIRFVEQPIRTQILEYSILEPSQAFSRSILDPLLVSPQTEALLEEVEGDIEAPDLDAEWLRDNGNLRQIVEAFASVISVEGSGDEARFEVDLPELRLRLDLLFASELTDRREFIGGALAALRSLFSRDSLRVYWQGELREISFQFSREDRTQIQNLDRWMARQIQSSLLETDILLPVIEGLVCAAGIGLATWGAVDDSLSSDTRLGLQLGGGGTTGLGCGALATHFIFDTGNHWISDSIGGGIGTVIGVGIPLLLHFLLGASTTPMGLPIDGRNPVEDFGP